MPVLHLFTHSSVSRSFLALPLLSARRVKLLVGVLPFAFHGLALLAAGVPSMVLQEGRISVLALPLAVPVYVLALVTAAGLVGRLSRHWIVAGRFDRDASTPLYRGRLIYGAAWTSIFYCKPVYHAVLGFAPLKAWTLRLFGYRGSLDFTTYPDSWIRDLPLLDIGPNVYISNRATIGTNIVQADGRILVGKIRLEERVLVGHLAMLAPGCELGAGTEVGVGAAIGMGVGTGKNVRVGPMSTVNHGACLGDGVTIGTKCLVGRRVTIVAGIRVPDGSVIPDRARIECPADLERVLQRAVAGAAGDLQR